MGPQWRFAQSTLWRATNKPCSLCCGPPQSVLRCTRPIATHAHALTMYSAKLHVFVEHIVASGECVSARKQATCGVHGWRKGVSVADKCLQHLIRDAALFMQIPALVPATTLRLEVARVAARNSRLMGRMVPAPHLPRADSAGFGHITALLAWTQVCAKTLDHSVLVQSQCLSGTT